MKCRLTTTPSEASRRKTIRTPRDALFAHETPRQSLETGAGVEHDGDHLDGPHTIVVLNGVKVTDYKEGDPVPEKKLSFEPERGLRPNLGWFGLQNHSDNDIVFFKEVAIKPLKAGASSE